MPILKHALNKERVDKKRTEVNKRTRTQMKSAIKKFKTSPKNGEGLTTVFSALDRAAKKHIIHTGKANRLKSRLTKLALKASAAK